MKKAPTPIQVGMAALILILSLTACGDRNTGSDSPSPTATPPSTASSTPEPTDISMSSPSGHSDELILKSFQDFATASLSAEELFAQFKQLIVQTEPAQADEFIRTMEAYYKQHLPEEEQKFEAANVQEELMKLEWPITEAQVQSIKDEAIQQLVKRTLAGGYKLETAEGFVFPIVDYSQMLAYGDKLSIAMNAYLDVMAAESDTATASDGGLVISWDELASRTLAAESYVMTFPDTPERAAIEQRYVNYLSMYLVGLNNTPIFDYDTFVILPEVSKQYEQMVASHGGTVTGQLTKQLLTILEGTKGEVFVKGKNGEQTDIPALKHFRDTIETEAHSKLPSSKNK